MKKLATLVLALLMVVSLFAVTASADSYIENDQCTAKFEIKKANPANVVKDGKIGEGEYAEVIIDKTDLCLNFSSASDFELADKMADTIKYYFSWDETHGLNFAVVYDATADGFNTNIPMGTDAAKPMDDFCANIGLSFNAGKYRDDGVPLFYYSIGKDIATGKYLTGHWDQLGTTGAYSATGGVDFEVSYSGTVVTFEWSVPFSHMGYDAVAGTTIELNMSACAGNVRPSDDGTVDMGHGGLWSVALGQHSFACVASGNSSAAYGTLSDELIPGGNTATETPADGTTPAPTQTTEVITSIITEEVVVTNDEGEVVTNEEGEAVTEIITSIVTKPAGNGNTNVPTGDPAVIAAVVAAISACGVVVAKKRK